MENFKEGFIFTESGGAEAYYNDAVNMTIIKEGHVVKITDNIYIQDGTYTLGITAEYKAILDGLVAIKYAEHDIIGLYRVVCLQTDRSTLTGGLIMDEALKAKGPVWIECVIDREERVLPMIPAGKTVNDIIFN